MNSEKVQRIVQDVLENVLSLNSITYWIIGLVALMSAGLGAFIHGYFRQKAGLLVTKEELNEILGQLKESTRASEEIRAEINRIDSLSQRRWEAKRIYYLKLLEALRIWGELGRVGIAMHDKEGELVKDFDGPDQPYKELPKQLKETARSFARLVDEAPVFLSDGALVVLNKFANMVSIAREAILDIDVDSADDRTLKPFVEFWKVLEQAAGEARNLLQNEATRELGLKASEWRND